MESRAQNPNISVMPMILNSLNPGLDLQAFAGIQIVEPLGPGVFIFMVNNPTTNMTHECILDLERVMKKAETDKTVLGWYPLRWFRTYGTFDQIPSDVWDELVMHTDGHTPPK